MFPNDVTRLRIHSVFPDARAYPLMTIPNVIRVNPLQTTLLELGIVSGRVALLLRSAEIQPVFEDL
jgi:hypothetical protein